jgi:phosphatidylglycerophosphate synthase
VANLAVAALFTTAAAHTTGDRVLTVPNMLTMSRAVGAAMLCGTAASGRGRLAGLWALLIGCTAVDWLDGPLARRLGPTRLGAVLDLESDSWLTLWGAVAAVRLGRLPAIALAPPVLRYVVALGPAPAPRPWQRAAGVAQMVVIAGALTRWRPPRALAAGVAAVQIAALVGYRVRDASTEHDVPAPCVGDAGAHRPLPEPLARAAPGHRARHARHDPGNAGPPRGR